MQLFSAVFLVWTRGVKVHAVPPKVFEAVTVESVPASSANSGIAPSYIAVNIMQKYMEQNRGFVSQKQQSSWAGGRTYYALI